MASADYDWRCQDCTFHTPKYGAYITYVTLNSGKRKRLFITYGTVMDHQERTGHTRFSRKTGPAV